MTRSIVSARVLNKLLQECAAMTPQCKQCAVGSVVETPVDETGCNWKVSLIQGGHCGDCLAAMSDFIDGLRTHFFLNTSDTETTSITAWAGR